MAISNITKGTFASGSSSVSPGLPASMQSGDFCLMFIESANQAISITTAGSITWTQVTNSPVYTGSAASAGGVRLAVYYGWYTSGSTAPTIADSGNHTTAIIISFRNVSPGSPFDATPVAGKDASNTTAISTPAITTATADALVVNAIGLDQDVRGTSYTGGANANLTSFTVQHYQTISTGVGGGLAVFTGFKSEAGDSGSSTATKSGTGASSTTVYLTIALRPKVMNTLTLAATNVKASNPAMTRTKTTAGYHIERRVGADGEWTEIDVDNASPYTDTGPDGTFSNGVTYYHRVRLYSAGAYGDYSNIDEVTFTSGDTTNEEIIAYVKARINIPLGKTVSYLRAFATNAKARAQAGRISSLSKLQSAYVKAQAQVDRISSLSKSQSAYVKARFGGRSVAITKGMKMTYVKAQGQVERIKSANKLLLAYVKARFGGRIVAISKGVKAALVKARGQTGRINSLSKLLANALVKASAQTSRISSLSKTLSAYVKARFGGRTAAISKAMKMTFVRAIGQADRTFSISKLLSAAYVKAQAQAERIASLSKNLQAAYVKARNTGINRITSITIDGYAKLNGQLTRGLSITKTGYIKVRGSITRAMDITLNALAKVRGLFEGKSGIGKEISALVKAGVQVVRASSITKSAVVAASATTSKIMSVIYTAQVRAAGYIEMIRARLAEFVGYVKAGANTVRSTSKIAIGTVKASNQTARIISATKNAYAKASATIPRAISISKFAYVVAAGITDRLSAVSKAVIGYVKTRAVVTRATGITKSAVVGASGTINRSIGATIQTYIKASTAIPRMIMKITGNARVAAEGYIESIGAVTKELLAYAKARASQTKAVAVIKTSRVKVFATRRVAIEAIKTGYVAGRVAVTRGISRTITTIVIIAGIADRIAGQSREIVAYVKTLGRVIRTTAIDRTGRVVASSTISRGIGAILSAYVKTGATASRMIMKNVEAARVAVAGIADRLGAVTKELLAYAKARASQIKAIDRTRTTYITAVANMSRGISITKASAVKARTIITRGIEKNSLLARVIVLGQAERMFVIIREVVGRVNAYMLSIPRGLDITKSGRVTVGSGVIKGIGVTKTTTVKASASIPRMIMKILTAAMVKARATRTAIGGLTKALTGYIAVRAESVKGVTASFISGVSASAQTTRSIGLLFLAYAMASAETTAHLITDLIKDLTTYIKVSGEITKGKIIHKVIDTINVLVAGTLTGLHVIDNIIQLTGVFLEQTALTGKMLIEQAGNGAYRQARNLSSKAKIVRSAVGNYLTRRVKRGDF